MPYCIQCGKELHSGARFCFHCGATVPDTEPAPFTPVVPEVPVVPEAPEVPDSAAPAPQPQTPEPKKNKEKPSVARTIGTVFCLLLAALIIGIVLYGVIYSVTPKKLDAKKHAKREVEAAWQEFDPNMELVSITYDSVNVDEWDDEEIAAYIAEKGDLGMYDVDGNKYDSHWDYWESKGYDPYTDTYHIFTVKGDYHVIDNRKQDYEGEYCVTVLHIVHWNLWDNLETELELPDELKQYLPD